MTVRSVLCFALVLLASMAAAPALRAEENSGPVPAGVPWVKQVDAALARAKAEKKPVLVFCYGSLSAAAKHLKTRVWTDARVAKALAQHFVPLLLNMDAIDSAQSGTLAMRRFGIRMIPTHLILDSGGQALATERGVPAADAAGMVTWIEDAARSLRDYRKRLAQIRAQPEAHGLQVDLLQFRLILATRVGRFGGHLVVHQPPESAHNRQVDHVIADAQALATKLDSLKHARAYQAWIVWAHAALAGDVSRRKALDRLDGILDAMAERRDPAGASVAFNTAYALFERDPGVARRYLRRVIASWSKSDVYWKARVYEAYSYGRTGATAKARSLFEAIVKEGPAGNDWVKSAQKTLRQMAAHDARKRKGD